MKYQFRLSNEERLKVLQGNWLIFLYEFFEEKTVFHISGTSFLAFLDPHTIKPHEDSRVLLFAYNRSKELKMFESSISVGLLQGRYVSKITHASHIAIETYPGIPVCVEFPLRGNMTPRGKYKIGIEVKNSKKKVEYLGEEFSIHLVVDTISNLTSEALLGIPAGLVSGWALRELKNKEIWVSRADVLYLGTTTGAQLAIYHAKKEIGEKIGHNMGTLAGTALPGVADGILSKMFGVHLPSLTLTVE